MPQPISLKEAERKVFQTVLNDGLWDIFLGCFFLMFAVVLNLSTSLGDLWSSVVLFAFWCLVYLVIRWIRKNVVEPRVGEVKFGEFRKAKLTRLNIILLVVNILALFLGVVAAWYFLRIPGQLISIGLGVLLLIAFSLAATYLDFRRLYIYGLLLGVAPPIGEYLYTYRKAAHHGLPITFGTIAGIMMLVGLVLFLRFLRDYPAVVDSVPVEKV